MAYIPYADESYYHNAFQGSGISKEEVAKWLRQASRHIDTLTYNRVISRGFVNLTSFQQDIIREVCCLQAEFEYENEDEINMILNNYSINGVSAKFGESWNVFTNKGVAIKKDVYAMLEQTGLCCRLTR